MKTKFSKYRRTATSTNSIYFTNYLEAVLCSYLKEKKCIMINVFSFMIQIFWMIMREALFAKMYSNTNWFFRDYNKLIHKVKFICCSYEQIIRYLLVLLNEIGFTPLKYKKLCFKRAQLKSWIIY